LLISCIALGILNITAHHHLSTVLWIIKMSAITGKSQQRGIRFRLHIDAWLQALAAKIIIDEKYESVTGNDALTGIPKNGEEKKETANG
jgi:hypothetical protein